MNPVLLAVVSLRAAALGLSIAGQSRASDSLYSVADALEAGRATDEHMALVAEKLKAGTVTDADWDDVATRIADARADLHGD